MRAPPMSYTGAVAALLAEALSLCPLLWAFVVLSTLQLYLA